MICHMRPFLALSLFLSPLAGSFAHAQVSRAPLASDRVQIAACVGQVPAAGAGCVGSVAVPCVRAMAGDRRDAEISCARREQEVWRERLGLASRALLGGLDPGARTRFVSLQLAWEGYAAQKCAFFGATQPPARSAGMQAGCELRELAQRSLEVERALPRQQQPRRPAQNPPSIIR